MYEGVSVIIPAETKISSRADDLLAQTKPRDLYTSALLQHHPQHSRQTAELQLRDITGILHPHAAP